MEIDDDLRAVAGWADDFFNLISSSWVAQSAVILLYLFVSMPLLIVFAFIPLIYYSSLLRGVQKYVFIAMIFVWLIFFFDIAEDYYYARHPQKYERIRREKEKREAEERMKLTLSYRSVLERRMMGKPLLGISAFFSRLPFSNRRLASFVSGVFVGMVVGLFFIAIGFVIMPLWVSQSGWLSKSFYVGLTTLGYAVCCGVGSVYAYYDREGSRDALLSRAFTIAFIGGILFAAFAFFVNYSFFGGIDLFMSTAISGIFFVSVGWFFPFIGGLLGKDMR